MTTCFEGLPEAIALLWQLVHVPGATPWWRKNAGVQATVRWQILQGADVGMCCTGIYELENMLPAMWHMAHSLGVPWRSPFTWQVSHRTERCAPLSGKPVIE